MIDLGKDTSIDEFGTSLLSRAQQNARRQRRRDSRSDRNAILALLGGQLVGGILKNKFDNDFEKFLYDENELKKRATLQARIQNNAQDQKMFRAAEQHKGGESEYVYDYLVGEYAAGMQSNFRGQTTRDPVSIQKIAEQMANDNLEEELKLFRERKEISNRFAAVAGEDMTTFNNALKNIKEKQSNIGYRAMRKIASFFGDSDDLDTNNALYRSATTSKIYDLSEKYQTSFDDAYRVTSNARVASDIAEYIEDAAALYNSEAAKNAKELGKEPPAALSVSEALSKIVPAKRRDFDVKKIGDTTYGIINDTSGKPIAFVPVDGVSGPITAETVSTIAQQQRYVRRPVNKDKGLMSYGTAMSSLTNDDQKLLRELLDEKTKGMSSDAINNVSARMGFEIESNFQRLNVLYGDAIPNENTLRRIAAKSLVIEQNAFDKPIFRTMASGFEHPLITLIAVEEEYGSYDNIPERIKEPLSESVAQSLRIFQGSDSFEVKNAIKLMNEYGSGFRVENRSEQAGYRVGDTVTILDFLEGILKSRGTRLPPTSRVNVSLRTIN
jgi:hypothetical protein